MSDKFKLNKELAAVKNKLSSLMKSTVESASILKELDQCKQECEALKFINSKLKTENAKLKKDLKSLKDSLASKSE